MKTLFILTLLFSTTVFAGRGVIITHEAPLLPEESFDTRPVQHVRQGDVIFIHDFHFGTADYEVTFSGYTDEESEQYNKVSDGPDKIGFFRTMDRTGAVAFIEKKYVKLIYKDEREKQSSVDPWKNDPTDYRLEEPLPEGYPLYDVGGLKASAALAFGPSRKINYPYFSNITRESFTGRMGGEFTFARRVSFDKYDRFYFGGMGQVYTSISKFTLENGNTAEELYSELGAGPMLSYFIYRGENWGITYQGGITINWQRVLVNQVKANGDSEQRIFSAFNLTPKMQLLVTRSNLIPSFDVMFGTNFQFNLDTALTAGKTPELDDIWREGSDDSYIFPTGGVFSLFVGIHSTY